MSLASPYQEQYYVADGVTTSFAFGQGFTALNEIDIKCIIYFEDGTNCVPIFNVNMATGFINIVSLTKPDGTLLTVPPAGSIVRIFRKTPEAQNVTASQLQNYTAKQLERVFDSLVAMIQEVSYSDIHKTVRLTETQRDIAIDYLPDDKDQAVIYWDVESRKLMPADFGQNQVVKSDGVEWLVYNQSEGKVYFIPRQGGNPIPIGRATIHNDLSGRNAPDCHPESAITGLREHLQELRDKDLDLEGDVQTALNRSQEAKDTADEAKETAEYAQTVAGQAKDIAEDAKETAEDIEGIAQEAKDTADEAKEIAQDAKDIAEGVVEDIETVEEGLANHIANKSNPHEVTKAQVGLGNVDNTSDLNKPISTATQTALDLKMPISTKYGASISLTIDSSTYVVTAQLKDQDNNNLGTAQTIDLPLESVVVSGSYDSDTKEVILVLENGSEIRFSVADLISGLQSEITAQNPLDADLVNDSTSAHKFVSATEKTNWNNHIANTNNPHQVTKAQVGLSNVDNTSDLDKPISTAAQTALNGKQATISDLATIRSNAQAGKAASDTIATYGNIVTHNVSEFATAAQGAKANTAVQPGDLATVATTGSYNDLSDKPTIPSLSNRVNGAPLSNSASVFYGTSSTAAATVEKAVSIPSITTLDVGTVIVIQPTITSTVANSTIKLNNFSAYPMRYNNAAITTSTDSIVWNAAYPSVWVFDGTYWRFVAHGIDSNTTYSTMSVAEGTTGTATSNRVLQAANLKQIIQDTTLTDIDVATTGAVSATDTITGGIGKLQATKANKSELPTVNNPTIIITQGGVTKGSFTLNQATGDTIALDAGGSNASWGNISGTLSNQTDLQNALDAKQATITGAATTIVSSDLATARAVISNSAGKIAASTVTSTELGYLQGATSSIQGQLDLKPNASSLADVAFSGYYSDLLYQPTLGTMAAETASDYTKTSGLATVAISGSYNDLSNKPTIPAVNNPTITITQGGVTKGSFTLNQTSGETIALDAGGGNVVWGNISGTLANQTDLQNALDNKVSTGHQIIAFQEPTSASNYTWYRKYADGWVEQGGRDTNQTVSLPIAMSDTNYCIQVTGMGGASNNVCTVFGTIDITTTGFRVQGNGVYNSGISGANNAGTKRWYVCGMAAS